ncbi:MAG TPA: LuxR C-terminal-related transcriptional regulator [Puia sp.]|nr:LuxR C-terminal-related transcriptional regulator [Puia sp.]
MIAEKYKILSDQRLPKQFVVPDAFFMPDENKNPFCVFMISCLGADRFLYLDDNFFELTGYTNEQFRKGGMDFWFPLINPEDMQQVSARIIESHKAMAHYTTGDAYPAPLVLEYRFRHPTNGWVGLRDTRYLVSFSEEKIIDQVLCRFDRLPMDSDEWAELDDWVRKEKSCTRLLEVAMLHEKSKSKTSIEPGKPGTVNDSPSWVGLLTTREKEILHLISEGLSTKMIADRCHISIHTVETHRRHLLEKIQVRNSMELVKEASKVYWL